MPICYCGWLLLPFLQMSGVIYSEDWSCSKSESVLCSLNQYLLSTNYVPNTEGKVGCPQDAGIQLLRAISKWEERPYVLSLTGLAEVTFCSSERSEGMHAMLSDSGASLP